MLSFHRTLVNECGLPTLSLFVGILESIYVATMKAWGDHTTGQDALTTPAARLKSLAFHGELTELIASGEGDLAARLMEDHLEYSANGVTDECLSQPVDPTVIRLDW